MSVSSKIDCRVVEGQEEFKSTSKNLRWELLSKCFFSAAVIPSMLRAFNCGIDWINNIWLKNQNSLILIDTVSLSFFPNYYIKIIISIKSLYTFFVSGCHMISTISVHQPPPSPAHRMMMGRGGPAHHPLRRLLNLQYLDLTDCASLEDSGLKMVVENCPQLIYLFLRRCSAITGNNKTFLSILF